MPAQPDHEVVIVGGGFSGIGAAIALQDAGIEDYLIVEDGEGFGGTWRWNTYPGIAVDIPSFSYQFSFAKRVDWSRTYAPGAELLSYAEDCARRHGLHDQARFRTRIADATRAQWAASSAGPAAASDANTSLMRPWIGESMAAWKYVTGVRRAPSGWRVGSVRSR